MEKRGLFVAVTTLLGTMIGAGIFALPFVFSRSGFLLGLLNLIVVGSVMTIVSLYLAEVILRTKGKHQVVGLAARYLGPWGKWMMYAAVMFSIYGALIAYTFAAGEALSALFGIPARLGMYVFFTLGVMLMYGNLAFFEKVEEVFTPLKVAVVLLLSLGAFALVRVENLTSVAWSNMFVPYGVVLFAFTAVSIIPEVVFEVWQKRVVRTAIIVSMLCAGVVYALFSAMVLGVAGSNVREVATVTLGNVLDHGWSVVLNVFTVLAVGTAFVALGFALKDMFMLDWKKKEVTAWVYVVAPPSALMLLGIGGFVRMIEISGIVGIGTMLVLIILMHDHAKSEGDREPEFVVKDRKWVKILIVSMVLVGVVYELVKLLGI